MSDYKVYKKKWPRKNLGHMLNFLEEQYPQGISIYTMSKKFKMTPQAVSNMFVHDDMKLSKAEWIARQFGYELRLFFPKKTYSFEYEPKEPKRTFPNAGNLAGLVQYIYDSNVSPSHVAERINLYSGALNRAFERGDILLSVLNAITDALGIFTFWEFKPNENSNKT